MGTFWAVRPHDAGVFHAEDVRVVGETRKEVLEKAQSGLIGGRYLSQIVTEDGLQTLWTEGHGWTKVADTILPN